MANWQLEHVDGLTWKQEETEEHVSVVKNTLNLVTVAVKVQLSGVEGSLTCLRTELHE